MSHHHHTVGSISKGPSRKHATVLPEILPAKPWIITRLRSLTPARPLTFREAKVIAEHQAATLLDAWDLQTGSAPRVPEEVVSELPRIDVYYRHGLNESGHSTWDAGAWRIAINADEPRHRQRFTLAHELKHIIDSPHEDAIYANLPARTPAEQHARTRHIEALCDHFAACLLMPKSSVKRTWGNGTQDLADLARAFDVSQTAMAIRLQNIGLTPRPPRLSTALGRTAVGASYPSHRHYHRTSNRARSMMLHTTASSATMAKNTDDPALVLTTKGASRWV